MEHSQTRQKHNPCSSAEDDELTQCEPGRWKTRARIHPLGELTDHHVPFRSHSARPATLQLSTKKHSGKGKHKGAGGKTQPGAAQQPRRTRCTTNSPRHPWSRGARQRSGASSQTTLSTTVARNPKYRGTDNRMPSHVEQRSHCGYLRSPSTRQRSVPRVARRTVPTRRGTGRCLGHPYSSLLAFLLPLLLVFPARLFSYPFASTEPLTR